jgi:class 3 adenylate cyclase/tetratricopeptide (TPR) repeat protein
MRAAARSRRSTCSESSFGTPPTASYTRRMPVCPQCGHENPEGAKFCNACAAPIGSATPPREQRKTVTVLFCDIVESTALGESTDPEALRALLAGYFARMKAIVERHGGTVEKFIGDAVMAVFGVPVVHEDDALRAIRAAAEMQDALPDLGVRARIGVSTGEVVTGTAERLATGDAVNVAARLEQAAPPGEILIGEETFRLVRGAVETESVEALGLKGKAAPVAAYRLLAAVGDAPRRHSGPMVGRQREQRLLVDAWDRVVSGRSCQLFTILGAAGVGKSRLAAEFLTSVRDASIARARCLPYGEGITYWPVVEILKQLPQASVEGRAAQTLHGLLTNSALVTSSDEIAWAFRKQLEAVAAGEPLVCVFDDLQWGEETYLDLVEHVADLSRDAPILLLCMARPELLDRRAGWAGGKMNAVNVLLEPLAPDETEQLISSLARLEQPFRDRIALAAEGNPLFVEEMVALAEEAGDGEVAVPPTIQALLSARLDQLDPAERDVLQRGSVEGRIFHRGAVQALAPAEQGVTTHLTALVRKELVRPYKAQVPGDDAFRFRHLLIRDAAYDALPKTTRADLHERFAAWLEGHGADLVEMDEIVGYHLEQACRYRGELGTVDDATRALARAAARRLGEAGRRAFQRKDAAAAVNLISRAAALLPPDDPERVELIPNMRAMQGMSGELAWAHSILSEALESGQEQLRVRALVQRGLLRLFTDADVRADELIASAEEAIAVLSSNDDELGLARAWRLIEQAHYLARRAGPSTEAAERALVYARRARDEFEVKENIEWLAVGHALGPTPAPEAARRIDSLREDAKGDKFLEATLCSLRGSQTAMCGDAEGAEEAFTQARDALDERDLHRNAFFQIHLGLAEPLLANGHLLEREQRAACEELERLGEKTAYSSVAAMLARTLCAQGRHEEAEHYTRASEAAAHPNDVLSQIVWRSTRAKVLAGRNQFEAAEELALEAVAFAEQSDFLSNHGDALMDLAEVLRLAGRWSDAVDAFARARALYERKGNIVMAERARTSQVSFAGA